jgi:hypothetical protein
MPDTLRERVALLETQQELTEQFQEAVAVIVSILEKDVRDLRTARELAEVKADPQGWSDQVVAENARTREPRPSAPAVNPVTDEESIRVLVAYSKVTGHRVRFEYSGSVNVREVAVYEVSENGKTFSAYDLTAQNLTGGRGAYRTFRFDRVLEAELV